MAGMTYESIVAATRTKFYNADVSNVQGTMAFQINSTNWIKLINGKLNPVVAFTTGKLTVDGDVNAALEMTKFLG